MVLGDLWVQILTGVFPINVKCFRGHGCWVQRRGSVWLWLAGIRGATSWMRLLCFGVINLKYSVFDEVMSPTVYVGQAALGWVS